MIQWSQAVPGRLTREPGTVPHGSTGQARKAVMGLPFVQAARHQRFINDHPEWSIHAQDRPGFTAEKDDGTSRHIVAHPSLRGLLDRLDEIEAGQ